MRVDKAFCKSTGSSLGRKNMCNKSKSITRTSIYSSKDKVLSFLLRKWSKCINLLPGCWLVTPWNGAISRAQCWFLLVELALNRICSRVILFFFCQVSLGEWQSMFSSPCITPTLPPWPLYSWAYWAMTGKAGKEADYAENWWSYLLGYWILPQWKSHFDEHLHGTQVCGILYPFRDLTTYFFLRRLSHQFSSHVLSKILTIPFIHWLQSIKQ